MFYVVSIRAYNRFEDVYYTYPVAGFRREESARIYAVRRAEATGQEYLYSTIPAHVNGRHNEWSE